MAEQTLAAGHKPRRHFLLPYALLALCMFFWASNWIVGRALHQTTTPAALNFWRWGIAAALLLPFSWGQVRQSWPIIRRHWLLMLTFGITGAGAFHALIYTGLRHTEAINALLLNSTIPVAIILMSWLWHGETISRRQALGIVISFLGVFTIIGRGEPAALLHLHINQGDILILLALPIWSFYCVLLRRRPPGIGDLAFLQVVSTVAMASATPFYAWDLAHGASLDFDAVTLSCFVYIAVFASLVGYIFWNWAVAEVGANTAGFTSHLMPAFGAALAVLVLHEQAYPYHAVGIALILAGVFLSTVRRAPAR